MPQLHHRASLEDTFSRTERAIVFTMHALLNDLYQALGMPTLSIADLATLLRQHLRSSAPPDTGESETPCN